MAKRFDYLRQLHILTGDERGARLLQIMEAGEARIAVAEADPHLTPLGKRAKIEGENAALRATLNAWREEVVAPMARNLAAETDRLIQRTRPAEDVNDYTGAKALRRELRFSEIRRALGPLDPLQARALYFDPSAPDEVRQALVEAPPVILRELNRAPRFAPLLDPSLVAQDALGRAEMASPDTAETVRNLRENLARLESLAMAAAQGLAPEPSAPLPPASQGA